MAPGLDIAVVPGPDPGSDLRRIIRRGDLSILRIGWRAGRTPVTLLARGRGLLGGRAALLLRDQGRSQYEACA